MPCYHTLVRWAVRVITGNEREASAICEDCHAVVALRYFEARRV